MLINSALFVYTQALSGLLWRAPYCPAQQLCMSMSTIIRFKLANVVLWELSEFNSFCERLA